MSIFLWFFRYLSARCLLMLGLLLLAACGTPPARNQANSQFSHPFDCTGNAYLEKYGCSVARLQQAAEGGDPDAQYALGYMYYYGIGADRDTQIARMWIVRAADQGQPLALQAEALMHIEPMAAPPRPGSASRRSAPRGSASRARRGHRQPIVRRTGRGQSPARHQPSVEKLNSAVPDKPLHNILPNYGQGQEQKQEQGKQLHKDQKTADPKPETTPPPLAQHSRHPDPRLLPDATPVTPSSSTIHW